MSRAVIEEKAIRHSQQLDLIYSQANMLYNIIPHAPWSSNETLRLAPGPHVNGVFGSASSTATTQLVGKLSQMTLSNNPTNATSVTTSIATSSQSSDVNFMQTTTSKTSQHPGGKKKKNNNRCKKNSSTQLTGQINQETNVGGSKSKQKFKYPCMVCQEYHVTKYCPHLGDVQNYVKQGQPSSQLAVLRNLFPAPQQMLDQVPCPPSGGASSSSTTILMDNALIGISTRANNYDQPKCSSTAKDTPLTYQPDSSLTFGKQAFEFPSHPSKVKLHRTMHNFNTQVAQHYNIVEDLAQAPCAMLALEVLQSFLTHRKDLLFSISGVDPFDTHIISFDPHHCEPLLPPLVTFMLTIDCLGNKICQIILDKGATTCIMSLSSWQALGSPTLVSSPTVFKAFDGHIFKLHGILTTLLVDIGGKTISIEEEVIDVALDYNLLLRST